MISNTNFLKNKEIFKYPKENRLITESDVKKLVIHTEYKFSTSVNWVLSIPPPAPPTPEISSHKTSHIRRDEFDKDKIKENKHPNLKSFSSFSSSIPDSSLLMRQVRNI